MGWESYYNLCVQHGSVKHAQRIIGWSYYVLRNLTYYGNYH